MRKRTGNGAATGHFGEIVQGALRCGETATSSFEEVVVTLPAPIFRGAASFAPTRARQVTVSPQGRCKAARAARLTLDHLGLHEAGGRLVLQNETPSGNGAGSSTMDVVAAIRAVGDACAVRLAEEVVSSIAVAAEGASDPLMFAEPASRIYAFRTGRTVALLPGPLPPLCVLGVRDGDPVDSLAIGPRRFDDMLLDRYEQLFDRLRLGIAHADAALIGQAASESALLNQRILPKPRLGSCLRQVERGLAVGVAVAHSGNLIGLLLAQDDPELAAKTADVERRLESEGLPVRFRFAIGASPRAASPIPRAVPFTTLQNDC